MKDKEVETFLHGFFDAYKHTSDYKDASMMEIMARRQEFEERLDKMWRNICANPQQVMEYRSQVQSIKHAGLEVLRSKTTGKHKIVHKR